MFEIKKGDLIAVVIGTAQLVAEVKHAEGPFGPFAVVDKDGNHWNIEHAPVVRVIKEPDQV